eukprot:6205770-Pleurochrysis_carterae.AAC.2
MKAIGACKGTQTSRVSFVFSNGACQDFSPKVAASCAASNSNNNSMKSRKACGVDAPSTSKDRRRES